ncbi:MAG: vanadium-dependent haloperoxidase [Candidatus Eisenbacteria bacterium]
MRSLLAGPTLLVLALLAGCAPQSTTPRLATPSDLTAGGPFLLGEALERELPAPGSEAAAAGALDHAALWPSAGVSPAAAGEASNPCVRWNALTRSLAATAKLPPPLFARAYALVSVACADGITAAGRGNRATTPAGCVVGGAASEVLLDLFPLERVAIAAALAEEAAIASAQGEGAVLRGLALGRSAGRASVRRGHGDGASLPFTGTMPTGDGIWTGTDPLLPACGSWRTWIATSLTEFAPEPPYTFGSPEDLADVAAVVAAAAARTPEQEEIVHKWADVPPPAIWNALLNERIVSRGLTAEEASRAHAFLNMAMADAFIHCWATKYEFWTARPIQRIPGLVTVVPTPNFPSYTSGHSTISAAAAAVMGELFPDEALHFRAQAEEAAMSRLYAGIHFPHDNDQGLAVGSRLGARVVARMRGDGAARTSSLAARE